MSTIDYYSLPRMGPPVSQIQRELRQARPFVSTADEAAVGILRTAEIIRRFYAQVLAPFDVTLAQYNVLRILRGAGDEGLPTLEVADRLIESAPGITLMMDRLVRKGWVRRRRSRQDRRQVRCYLMTPGAELLRRIDAPFNAAHSRGLADLTVSQCRTVIRLLDSVRRLHASLDRNS